MVKLALLLVAGLAISAGLAAPASTGWTLRVNCVRGIRYCGSGLMYRGEQKHR